MLANSHEFKIEQLNSWRHKTMKTFLRAFEVKYLGPTNHLGSRVKITDVHNNKSVTISFDYLYNNAHEVAEHYLEQQGITILCRAGSTKVDWLLSENFVTDLGEKAPKAFLTLIVRRNKHGRGLF